MVSRKSRRIVLFLTILILLGLAAWQADRYRKIPLDHVLSAAYWMRRWQGRDRYDPGAALFQHGDPARREVALTIDDGPDPRYEPPIAALLKQKSVAATFFLVGVRVKQRPDLAKLLADDGFELGNHTYDHQRLDALKPHEIANEIRLGAKRIADATGQTTLLLRPPGERYNAKVLQVAKSLGYTTVDWTVGAKDYDAQSPQYIAGRILDRTEPGSIILLHQDVPGTLGALPAIIDGLRRRGYVFVTVSAMLAHVRK